MTKMELNKVDTIGKAWFHRFSNPSGKRVYVPCSESDYRKLGERNPTNPTKRNNKWDSSIETWKVDTPTGSLGMGQYTVYPDGGLAVNITGHHAMIIPDKFMTGDILSQEGVDFINEFESSRH